ncbi:hypothetical protein DL770_010611 [Monosporascus sp. CRB-9-2]|nr:hypothetical protein DL770_010611 [Monosporascus sp. CRB-9-2]
MDGYNQLPHFDFGNVPLTNNLGDLPPIDWTFVGQDDLLIGLEERTGDKHALASPVLSCTECLHEFTNTAQLNKHAKGTSHHAYGCICGSKFTRLDALNRHITNKSSDAPQYPCGYCYRHQGTNGFRRYDHLVQHLKGYHKIETVDGLSRKAAGSSPAVATAPAVPIPGTVPVAIGGNATAQVQVPPFPCTIAGCVRGGAYGFYRQVDLLEHQSMIHLLDFQEYSSVQEFPVAMQLTQQNGNPGFEF